MKKTLIVLSVFLFLIGVDGIEKESQASTGLIPDYLSFFGPDSDAPVMKAWFNFKNKNGWKQKWHKKFKRFRKVTRGGNGSPKKVPEPGTMVLLASGLVGVGILSRKLKKRQGTGNQD